MMVPEELKKIDQKLDWTKSIVATFQQKPILIFFRDNLRA